MRTSILSNSRYLVAFWLICMVACSDGTRPSKRSPMPDGEVPDASTGPDANQDPDASPDASPPPDASSPVDATIPDPTDASMSDVDVAPRTPVLDRIAPAGASPGVEIRLLGSHLEDVERVLFGSTEAAPQDRSESELKVRVPMLSPGVVSVSVMSPSGSSNRLEFTIKNFFRVDRLLPSSNPVGGPVLIRGKGLGRVVAVRFGATTAKLVHSDDDEITTHVPAGAAIGETRVTIETADDARSLRFEVLGSYPPEAPSPPDVIPSANLGPNSSVPPISSAGRFVETGPEYEASYTYNHECTQISGLEYLHKLDGPNRSLVRLRRYQGTLEHGTGAARFVFTQDDPSRTPATEWYSGRYSRAHGIVLFSELTGRQLRLWGGYHTCKFDHCVPEFSYGSFSPGGFERSCGGGPVCCDTLAKLACLCDGQYLTEERVSPGDDCLIEDERRCTSYFDDRTRNERVVCRASKWQADPCPADELCDSRAGAEYATCGPIDPACRDRVPGDALCIGTQRYHCGPDLRSKFERPCGPNQHCVGEPGAARCACDPGFDSDGSIGCRDVGLLNECSVMTACPSVDYPCKQTSPEGYVCLGQFLETPMPDTSSPSGLQPSYTEASEIYSRVIRDRVTGLVWLGINVGSWGSAADSCRRMGKSSHDDWRLPSKVELESILDDLRSAPAADTVFRLEREVLWTGSQVAGATTHAWAVDFSDGRSQPLDKDKYATALCVRHDLEGGALSNLPIRYSAAVTRVTDNRTKLVWQRTANGIARTRTEAARYCANQLDGATPFRLPTKKELLTLIDPTRTAPAMDPLFGDPGAMFWTATSYAPAPEQTWTVDTSVGSTQPTSAAAEYLVRCVH